MRFSPGSAVGEEQPSRKRAPTWYVPQRGCAVVWDGGLLEAQRRLDVVCAAAREVLKAELGQECASKILGADNAAAVEEEAVTYARHFDGRNVGTVGVTSLATGSGPRFTWKLLELKFPICATNFSVQDSLTSRLSRVPGMVSETHAHCKRIDCISAGCQEDTCHI